MTQLSPSSFNEAKAAQVAFFFLLKAKQFRMNITKLRFIKWMYLAERFCYQKFGEPLTGDSLFSMQHGPVLSGVLYLIEDPKKLKKINGFWQAVVSVKPESRHQYIALNSQCEYKKNDDLRELSEAEIELLEEVWQEYGGLNAKQLETRLHDHQYFPEWHWKKGDGSNPIELESLLPILGYSDSETQALIRHIQSDQCLDRAFSVFSHSNQA